LQVLGPMDLGAGYHYYTCCTPEAAAAGNKLN
jgi:hypothetical protein